jgi:threonine synthase
MNVGHPSNLARIFDLYGGQIDEKGVIHKAPNMEELRNDIVSYSISDELTKDTIVNFYNNFNKIIEPHGAVGWAALQLYRTNNPKTNDIKSITFETANPSKFPEEIIKLIDLVPEVPNSLKLIQDKPEFPNPKGLNIYSDFKEFLLEEFQE